jgi:hypothetical protein
MYCSASPSMYCHRSLAAKTRVSLVFSQPATAPDAGNGSIGLLLLASCTGGCGNIANRNTAIATSTSN